MDDRSLAGIWLLWEVVGTCVGKGTTAAEGVTGHRPIFLRLSPSRATIISRTTHDIRDEGVSVAWHRIFGLIAFLSASDDAGHYLSYIRLYRIISVVTPASQRMPQFDGFECFVSFPFEKVAKDMRNCAASEPEY